MLDPVHDDTDDHPGATEEEVLRARSAATAAEGLRRMVETTAKIFEAVTVEYASMQRAAETIIRTFAEQVAPVIDAYARPDLSALVSTLGTVVEQLAKYLPPNWRGADIPDLTLVQSIAEDEGIALIHVPRASTVTSLLAAPNASARRALLEERSESIASDCWAIANGMTTARGRSHGVFLAHAIDALNAGHVEASQALSTNIIDTLGSEYVVPATFGHKWATIMSRNTRKMRLAASLRTSLVLLPLASAYVSYAPGDESPTEFSRHATSHGVSPQQYTPANAVIALMCAASLLRWLEEDLEAFGPVGD